MYEIEKDVPIPQKAYPGARKYPWPDMEVGDSFWVPMAQRGNLSRALTIENNRPGNNKRFSSRTAKDKTGVRVWRTE